MDFQGCESIFEPILGFPSDFELGGQYLLCGISVLTEPQNAWSPTTIPVIDESHITWWHTRGQPIVKNTDYSNNYRIWAIVVGEPKAGDNDALRPGTYLLVHGECGRWTPGKIGINYCWTHEQKCYQVYEEIHNKALGPGSRLAGLNFGKHRQISFNIGISAVLTDLFLLGQSMEDFLRKLRKAGGADGEESWKQLLDDILDGKKQGIRAAWRSFIDHPEAGRSVTTNPTPAN
ncbi:hypothetical protein E0Z10_g6517 [Xylaria hypoxylon]|uniref:Uncharacterized protein n=1 Tax=Xylaria hypoxylon TaxID=37992 RepID=A0A4Z0YFX1_9PEZI|nr:hypothetical protein E0Z10_g6517 [Xylaria hypoxylon]